MEMSTHFVREDVGSRPVRSEFRCLSVSLVGGYISHIYTITRSSLFQKFMFYSSGWNPILFIVSRKEIIDLFMNKPAIFYFIFSRSDHLAYL